MILGIERCFKRRSTSGRVLLIFSSLVATGLLLSVLNTPNKNHPVDTLLIYSIEQTEETTFVSETSRSQSENQQRMCKIQLD